MSENLREKIFHIATLTILAVIIVGGSALAYPTWRESIALKDKEAELAIQVAEKKAAIEKLIENQRRFKVDPDFVESIARRNRRVFPGELVFQFED